MSESIVERIAAWHASAIAEITVANGYQQTLSVTRPQKMSLDRQSIKDLTTFCFLSAGDDAVIKECETLDTAAPTITWWQQFETLVYVLGSVGDATLAVDTRLLRIVGDIHKRIGVELAAHADSDGPYCDGLAGAIDLLPWSIGVSEEDQCTVIEVPIRIKYSVLTQNPYGQT
jgi:hypothetical protein